MRSVSDAQATAVHSAVAMPDVLAELLCGRDETIPNLMLARTRSTPDAVFIKHGGKNWSYAESWKKISAFAGYLKERRGEAATGTRVAALFENSPEAIWAWLGTIVSGGIFTALNVEYNGRILEHALSICKPDVLISTSDRLAGLSSELRENCVLISVDSEEGGKEDVAGVERMSGILASELSFFYDGSKPTDVCSIMFTSGSTGASKGVLQPHRMFVRGAGRAAAHFGYKATDTMHLWTPLYHVGGQLHFALGAVVAGGSIAPIPRFSLSKFWLEVHQYQCTIIAGMTATFRMLLKRHRETSDGPLPGSRVRVAVAGPGLPPDEEKQFYAAFGCNIIDTYGMTEAEILTLPPLGERSPAGSVGLPSPDFDLQIVNSDFLPVSVEQSGDIVIRPKEAGLMMQGYQCMPEATVAAWQNLWFRPGDRGRFDSQGFLYIEGRSRDVIRRRGENISVSELEGYLRDYPQLSECAVVAIEDPMGEQAVKVFVEARLNKGEFDISAFRAWCETSLPRYMWPSIVEVVNKIPVNSIGKVDKLALQCSGDDIRMTVVQRDNRQSADSAGQARRGAEQSF